MIISRILILFLMIVPNMSFCQNDSIYSMESQIVGERVIANFYSSCDMDVLRTVFFEVYDANTLKLLSTYIAGRNSDGSFITQQFGAQFGCSFANGIALYTIDVPMDFAHINIQTNSYLFKVYLIGNYNIRSNILSQIINR